MFPTRLSCHAWSESVPCSTFGADQLRRGTGRQRRVSHRPLRAANIPRALHVIHRDDWKVTGPRLGLLPNVTRLQGDSFGAYSAKLLTARDLEEHTSELQSLRHLV